MSDSKSKFIDHHVLTRFLDAYALELNTEEEKEILRTVKQAADDFVELSDEKE